MTRARNTPLPPWGRYLLAAVLVLPAAARAADEGQAIAVGSPPRPLAGVVVDAAGKPAAGAEVWLIGDSPWGKVDVYERATTDAGGRFRVTIPGRWFDTVRTIYHHVALVAYKPGHCLAALAFGHQWQPPAADARLVLGPPASAAVQIRAPDGKPVAGARVDLTAILCDKVQTTVSAAYAHELAGQDQTEGQATPLGYAAGKATVLLPEGLRRKLTGVTDARGNVSAPGVSSTENFGITVVSEAFGTQQAILNRAFLSKGPAPQFPSVFTLRPAGKLTGRLAAEKPEAVRGVVVTVTSQSNVRSPVEALHHTGRAVVIMDAEGRFEVPALAEGAVAVHVAFARGSALRARPLNAAVQLKAGETVRVELTAVPAVRVKGLVRESGSGRPLAGVFVEVGDTSGTDRETVETDAAGRFVSHVLPGDVYVNPLPPRPYRRVPVRVAPGQSMPGNSVPAGVAEHELPPVELVRGITVRGNVVDDTGKPVAGAAVLLLAGARQQQGNAFWWEQDARAVTADERGDFVIEGLDPRLAVQLQARHGRAFTDKSVDLRPGETGPVTVRVSKAHAVALAGSVRDGAGKPVAGAKVEVWSRRTTRWSGDETFMQSPRLEATLPAATDAAGTFQTPPRFEPNSDYRATLRADGYLDQETGWLPAAAGQALTFPTVSLRRVLALDGRILDRQGKPVEGAKVTRADGHKRVTAVTGPDGRFRLPDVPEGSGFVFVEKAGFRFHGQLSGAGTVDVVLPRSNEPAGKGLTTLPPALPGKERLALASRLLDPFLARVLAKDNAGEKLRPLEMLAKLDPARVLELIDKKPFKESWYDDYLRRAVAQRLLKDSPDEARTVIEAMQSPESRASGYLDLADALPADKRAEKLELLGQALLHGRNVPEADHRLVAVSQVARRLRELGETEQAAKLLRGGQETARNLPTVEWPGFARAYFATQLAAIDLPAGLALIKDLRDDFEYQRHHANIAVGLAARDPAESERVLGMVKPPDRLSTGAPAPYTSLAPITTRVRICSRMAAVDPERARRIAEQTSEPTYKAHCFGVMAHALAKSKPDAAAELLRRAFDVLAAHVESGRDQFNNYSDAASLAGCLVSVAERIDPQLVPEFFWRALSLRTPRPSSDDFSDGRNAGADAALALALARYDRAVARVLLEPGKGRAAEIIKWGHGSSFFPAWAVTDPHGAAKLLERLPEGNQGDYARLSVIGLLTADGDELWKKAYERLGLWLVDTEDD
jgi:uncharacterized GH25 family protein